jgi:enoyl-CoA hydratase
MALRRSRTSYSTSGSLKSSHRVLSTVSSKVFDGGELFVFMVYEYIISEVMDNVCYVTFDRPDQLNAVSVEMWDEIRDALLEADADGTIRVIILSGHGDAFCAGDDIQDILDLVTPTDMLAYAEHILECSGTIERINTPVVAKIDGAAYGVGCEIAGLCDVTVATEDATFSLVEPRIGVSPLNGLFRFPDLIGTKPAREMMLTARALDAEEALRIGLVSAVVDTEEIDDVVQARVDEIRENAPLAIEMTKAMINGEREGENEAINVLSYLCMTQDRAEGTSAFLEKHDPEWSRE